MEIKFEKYHALRNDFIVIDLLKSYPQKKLSELALSICDRRSGVGADGIIVLSKTKSANRKFEIYNSDGSWAEKSGNGLRIAGMYLSQRYKKNKFNLLTSTGLNNVQIIKKNKYDAELMTELDKPEFDTSLIPVKAKQKFMINAPLKIDKHDFPVTCLSVGNPHTVLLVDSFDFDWQSLGAEIENHKLFPNRTNVEFVKVTSRKKLIVADWERGAGATGSSGTGAAASVAACVTLGVADRSCEVQFENGSLNINWRDDDIIELTGPVEYICKGSYNL